MLARSDRYDSLVPNVGWIMNGHCSMVSDESSKQEITAIPGVIAGGAPALQKRIENLFLIGVPMAGSMLAVVHVAEHGLRWSDIVVFLAFYTWCGLGLSLGFHRLFSHRSYQAHPVLAAILCAGGTMSFQGSPFRWVLDHRRHHAHADKPGDVHSPHVAADGSPLGAVRGFWHAHVGWMFDRWTTDEATYGKGLRGEGVLMLFTRTHLLWLVLSLGLPWSLGFTLGGADAAWSGMLLGGCLRASVLHHVVWSVNSFGHCIGKRHHEVSDQSTDNLWIAILTFGDGWHNGHHRAPRSYKHGLAKDQVDINSRIIEWLEGVGWVNNVVRVNTAADSPVGSRA
jgi:stearoyl-CoA desaturase (Delta-9 desaturase)